MSRTRLAIIAFWVVIIIMLIWQFRSYDTGLTQDSIDHPQQQHFFFYHTNSAPVAPSAAHSEGADVEQTAFDVQPNAPSAGNFTCRVTVKNLGTAKATGVQVDVRPYKGIALGDLDNGHARPGTMNDSDPISQIGQWVTFPDLAPGEEATETAVFLNRSDVSPGANPQPEIVFETEKKTANDALQPPARRQPSD